MAKLIERLNSETVAALAKPGRYHDGGGLYLIVSDTGAKSWLFRYTLHARPREMGLGSLAAFPLAAARKRAREARALKEDGKDPLEAKRASRAEKRTQRAKFRSFQDEARAYIAAHRAGWKNPVHARQWDTTLETYAYPLLGKLHVADVDTDLVVKVLEPIWLSKSETGSRLRGRIEKILAYATTRKFRSGDNPARWRNHLDILLPKRGDVREVRHHPALAYSEIGGFMSDLRTRDGIAARALELTILCAVRTADTIGATWSEIDLAAKVWTLPKARTKTRELKVPLAPAAMAVLQDLDQGGSDDFVFAIERQALSNGGMAAVLDRMGQGNITVHGFRSTFRDWAADCTGFPPEVSEMALAHSIGSKTEAAYRRRDLFMKRLKLMAAWAEFCAKPSTKGDVVPMQRRTK